MNKKIFIIVGIFVFASITGWLVAKYYIFNGKKDNYLIELKNNISSNEKQASNLEITTIKIFLTINDEIIEEDIILQEKIDLPLEIIEAVLDEYMKRQKDSFKNIKLLGVYRDRNNIIYLDFSEGLKNDFYGDTNKEHLFLKSLYKTVTSNITDVEDIRILINGKEIDTIGGHIFILYGLKEAIRIDE